MSDLPLRDIQHQEKQVRLILRAVSTTGEVSGQLGLSAAHLLLSLATIPLE